MCLTDHYDMRTYGGVEGWLHALTSLLDGSEWSASRLGRFTSGEIASGHMQSLSAFSTLRKALFSYEAAEIVSFELHKYTFQQNKMSECSRPAKVCNE
jgi:hypothetical protein